MNRKAIVAGFIGSAIYGLGAAWLLDASLSLALVWAGGGFLTPFIMTWAITTKA